MYNIKQLVDKIPAEADINPSEYPVAVRIEDINEVYLSLVEQARQIASTEPISADETFEEVFTLVRGSNEFERTIPDVPILRVDFQRTGSESWCEVHEDQMRKRGRRTCTCGFTYFADEKRIFAEDARPGTLRVTYASGEVVPFTVGDYQDNTPPHPVWLPKTFVPLLYLKPALVQAEYYKTDRVSGILRRIERLEELFYTHYSRNSATDQTRLRANADFTPGTRNYR